MASEKKMIVVLNNSLLEVVKTIIANCISQSLHHCGLCSACIVMLSRHAFIDLDCNLSFSFMIHASHNLPKRSFIELPQNLVSIGNMVAHHNFVKTSESVKAVIIILSMTGAITP